jgi:hypothetical protein
MPKSVWLPPRREFLTVLVPAVRVSSALDRMEMPVPGKINFADPAGKNALTIGFLGKRSGVNRT